MINAEKRFVKWKNYLKHCPSGLKQYIKPDVFKRGDVPIPGTFDKRTVSGALWTSRRRKRSNFFTKILGYGIF
jgi:hypothetical protein